MANRLWGSTHHVQEKIGLPVPFRVVRGLLGHDPCAIAIHFIPPAECGFDMTKFDPSRETVICADSGMRHCFRRTADGVEQRIRFYGGYVRKDGVFVREGGETLLSINAALNHHMAKEFSKLAGFLPALLAEQGPGSGKAAR